MKNFSRGQTGTKVRCESRLRSQGKTPEFTKMGEIHDIFVLALCFSEGVKWGMGWVGVGTAVFGGRADFGQNPGKYSIFPQQDAKLGHPKNSRSYHQPSHPPCDALSVLVWFAGATPDQKMPKFLSDKKKTNKHKHFFAGRSLGQTGTVPGTNRDPSLGQCGTRPWDKPAVLC